MSHRPTNASLRVRINNIDYTVATPGPLDNCTLPKAPIIRIYGDASNGYKTCVHIHQVYPYVFIEYQGSLDPHTVNRYIAKLHRSLNHAIAISKRKNPLERGSQYIRGIVLVKGVPFYGFHASYSPFLKIHVADPGIVNRVVTILRTGTIMGGKFEVFESHLGFILQFFCDYGLYGCGWLNLGKVYVRGDNPSGVIDLETSPYFRESRLPLEIDVAAHQILNRHQLSPRNIHHELALPTPPLPIDHLVQSVRELWEDERQRRTAKGLHPSPIIPSIIATNDRAPGGGWVTETRSWETIKSRIEDERYLHKDDDNTTKDWEKWVMTTFESLEVLWEENRKTWRPSGVKEGASNPYTPSQHDELQAEAGVDVNEEQLSSQDLEDIERRERADRIQKTREWERLTLGDGAGPDDEGQLLHDDLEQDGPPSEVVDSEKATHFSASNLSTPQTDRRSQSRAYSPAVEATPRKPNPFSSEQLPRTSNKYLDLTQDLPPAAQVPRAGEVPTPSLAEPDDWVPTLIDAQPNETLLVSQSSAETSLWTSSGEWKEKQATETQQRSIKRRKLGRVMWADTSTGKSSEITKLVPQTEVDTRPRCPTALTYAIPPPTPDELLSSFERYGVPSQVYQEPFYQFEEDVPEKVREYAGLAYSLKGGTGVSSLEQWRQLGLEHLSEPLETAISEPSNLDPWPGWEYADTPPGRAQVTAWLIDEKEQDIYLRRSKVLKSQIEGPTLKNAYGFKITPPKASDSAVRERQNMTVLSMELLVTTRGELTPDYKKDGIIAICYSFLEEESPIESERRQRYQTGIFALNAEQLEPNRIRDVAIERLNNEADLLNRFIDEVVFLDPDILVGWQIQTASWGFLASRGLEFGIDVSELIGRAPAKIPFSGMGIDTWGLRHTSTFKVVGRHVLNVWRIMRAEHSLSHYSFENFVFHLLRRRIPYFSPATLFEWYCSPSPKLVSRACLHVLDHTMTMLELLEEAEIVTKNAEFARVFGVDFFSVLNRGSQFKVESFMFRIAKPESFVFTSPSAADVGKQNAAECVPLIMEPKSGFYNSPLLVLDFQSLYPSIMIAYNYCYSTCLGRVHPFNGTWKFGTNELQPPPGLLEKMQDHITVAPNGMIYAKQTARKSLLAKMLTELLETRVMVKQAMKGWLHHEDKALLRILDARQLGLKYIANTTYGYTSATFSGRMPAVEIADSIVQAARETLENAIRLIDSTPQWGAEVVYGDTDSLFIYLPGKTKAQAFRIGHSIADAVTAHNPAPIKLKFEKVYLPCVLLAKKRYVGFKFEDPDQDEPGFDAKGIETVRRDGTPATQKMVEACLKILFRTQDLSEVKEYCQRSWMNILENRVSIQDFIFSKEVKLGHYSDKVPPQPGAAVAAAHMAGDTNYEPQYGERIPYVITRGDPKSRLVDRAVAPQELLQDPHKQLDGVYYITRMLIPPLERVFNLVGADVRAWYDEMPKAVPAATNSPEIPEDSKVTIDNHFSSQQCIACGKPSLDDICEDCSMIPETTMYALLSRRRMAETRLVETQLVCSSCIGTAPAEEVRCESLDCEWLYARMRAKAEAGRYGSVVVDRLVAELS